jgi:hypothetical protein
MLERRDCDAAFYRDNVAGARGSLGLHTALPFELVFWVSLDSDNVPVKCFKIACLEIACYRFAGEWRAAIAA